MKIVALLDALPELGGGEKYALHLLALLAERHAVAILYTSDIPFDPTAIHARFGLDPANFQFVRIAGWWAVSRFADSADVYIDFMNRLIQTSAQYQILAVFFPSQLADARPAGFAERVGWARQRAMFRFHRFLDRLDPELFDTPSDQYLHRCGILGAWKSIPLLALRRFANRRELYRYQLGYSNLSRYQSIVSIGRYTAQWVKAYYGRDSEIVYPPIDTHNFVTSSKERVILSVGRFYPGPGSKKFPIMIEAFRKLHADSIAAGWKLVLVGAVSKISGAAEYLQSLRELATGLPVEFAANCPFPQLVNWYGRASVYWHAMGYGEDPERHPGLFEHFGMTTVEAMAAGCVPMVINGGGQSEIVTHRRDGFLWDTLDQLVEQFHQFTRLPDSEVSRLRAAASARAEDFSLVAFRTRACELFESVGIPVR
jgi:glycosyltransferase involved in cell wall biosynthesis